MPTHRENIFKKFGIPLDRHLSMSEISEKSKIPLEALYEIFKRGRGAWKNNLSSVRLSSDFSKNPDTSKYPRNARLSANQWGLSRIYSFWDKGTDYYTADADIAKRYGV